MTPEPSRRSELRRRILHLLPNIKADGHLTISRLLEEYFDDEAQDSNAKLTDYDEVFEPMLFERPVGNTFEEWRESVRKTELYQRGDTVIVWVNEGDLYPGPFVKRLVKRA